jgi:hypothetical protein
MNFPQYDEKIAVWYVIRIRGYLDERRAAWFEGMEIKHLPGGFTQIAGQVPDQAALFGLLSQVRDLGLELWLLERL